MSRCVQDLSRLLTGNIVSKQTIFTRKLNLFEFVVQLYKKIYIQSHLRNHILTDE